MQVVRRILARRKCKVFISYRRTDDPSAALLLYRDLGRLLRPRNLFMDIEGQKAGDDFVEVQDRRIAESDVVLAVIGRQFGLLVWPLIGAAAVMGFLAWRLYEADGPEHSLLRAVAAAILTAIALFALILPARRRGDPVGEIDQCRRSARIAAKASAKWATM